MHRPVADALASVIDASSLVESGCTLTFYSLADVLQEVYTNTDWVTPASTSGVLTANSAGRFPLAYFKDTLDYKAVLKDSDGVTIATINPIYKAAGFATTTDLDGYMALDGTSPMAAPLDFAESVAINSNLTINLNVGSATGNFVHVNYNSLKPNITNITLAQGAMRWVIFQNGIRIYPSSTLTLPLPLGTGSVPAINVPSGGLYALLVGEGGGVTRMLYANRNGGVPLYETWGGVFGIGDETTAIAAGTAKITLRLKQAITLSDLSASLSTAQASGDLVTVDFNVGGASILSTKLTIDNNETTSATAASAAVFGQVVTFSDASGDLLMTTTSVDFPTHHAVTFSNAGGALPTGLSAATPYYLTRASSTTFRLSTSPDNVNAGAYIAYTDAGSGTNTVHSDTWPIAANAQITIDIDDCDGSTGAKGLKVEASGFLTAS